MLARTVLPNNIENQIIFDGSGIFLDFNAIIFNFDTIPNRFKISWSISESTSWLSIFHILDFKSCFTYVPTHVNTYNFMIDVVINT